MATIEREAAHFVQTGTANRGVMANVFGRIQLANSMYLQKRLAAVLWRLIAVGNVVQRWGIVILLVQVICLFRIVRL